MGRGDRTLASDQWPSPDIGGGVSRLKSVTVMWPQVDRKVTVNQENEKERSWELLKKWTI